MTKLTKTQIDSKAVLARLLAMEGVALNHDAEAETAYFNMQDRSITLPVFKEMNGHMYDGMIMHEVAHALYTPFDEQEHEKLCKEVPFVFVNITEDARIEKLIQQKYPGGRRDFYEMYKEFSAPEKDFFGLSKKPLNELGTIDRINVFFKIGKFVDVPFKAEEKKFVEMVDNALTFDDAVKAAKAIYEYMKQTKQMTESQGKCDLFSGKKVNGKDAQGHGSTLNKFEKARAEETTDKQAKKDGVQHGEALSSKDIERNTVIHGKIFDKLKKMTPQTNTYADFKSLVKPAVNGMINRFNIKKAAKDYARTQVHKTGRLNGREISKFKTSDDLFLQNEIVLQEKNHGFVFFIDWSASMDSCIFNTVKQLAIMLDFCRNLQMPFEVYGFTSGVGSIKTSATNKIVGNMSGNQVFKLIESGLDKFTHEKVMQNIYESANRNTSGITAMGDTPLYNAALMSDIIMENFAKKHGREKNIMVLLSDGDSCDRLNKQGKQAGTTIMYNPQNGKNYRIETYHDVFQYVKERQKVWKMVGFFLSETADNTRRSICPKATVEEEKKVREDFKTKNYGCYTSGKAFDQFYVININQFNFNDRDKKYLDTIKYADNDKILEAWKKSITSHTKNMVFLNTFIDLIG